MTLNVTNSFKKMCTLARMTQYSTQGLIPIKTWKSFPWSSALEMEVMCCLPTEDVNVRSQRAHTSHPITPSRSWHHPGDCSSLLFHLLSASRCIAPNWQGFRRKGKAILVSSCSQWDKENQKTVSGLGWRVSMKSYLCKPEPKHKEPKKCDLPVSLQLRYWSDGCWGGQSRKLKRPCKTLSRVT